MGELVPILSSTAIRKQLPAIADQVDYQSKLAALKAYAKDHRFMVADLEAQVAIAQTLPEALKKGDVSAAGHKYTVLLSNTALNNKTIAAMRQLAAIPAADRRKFYAENSRPTRAALCKWYAGDGEQVADVGSPADSTKGRTYGVIYADPPWKYDYSKSNSRKIENQYPTMELEDICGLTIPTAKHCTLFLWATNPKLREALQVLVAWEFDYRTNLVWVKDKVGMGYYARQRHELLLVATKGSPGTPSDRVRPDSVFESPRLKHSQKPDCVYGMIEKMYPKKRKLELFAREARDGWDAWGNQAPQLQ